MLALPTLGVFSIYFIGSQFLTPPSQEISFENIGQSQQGTTTPKAISSAPMGYVAHGFEIPDIQGNIVTLGDFKGKILILVFWTTWNPAAQDQIAILESYYQKIKGQANLALVTINNQEDKSVVSSFVRRGEYQLTVLVDEDGIVGETYGIHSLPTFYMIDKSGIVRDRFIGVLSESEIREWVARFGVNN